MAISEYPTITDYRKAVKQLDIRTDHIKSLRSIRNDNIGPIGSSGKFATVFKMEDSISKKKYALKCFIRENVERKERYQAISLFLKNANNQYFCEYEYLDNEFSLTPSGSSKEELYPVVKMEWVEGETLNPFLKSKCANGDSQNIQKLYENWIELSKSIHKLNIAHGDLKHDNMIVLPNNEIKLIDYDGMFVPNLAGRNALEEGSINYQHPKRNSKIFNETLDYFSMIIIALSIKALTINQNLFKQFNDDENIIISANDFKNLHSSKIYSELIKLKDDTVNKLLEDLSYSLNDINYLPSFLNKSTSSIKINEQNPQLFIVNIDNRSRIDKGFGELYPRIRDILSNRIYELLDNTKLNKSVFLAIVEHNFSSKLEKNMAINFQPIETLKEPFINSFKSSNFEDSINNINKSILDFINLYKPINRPIVINLIANSSDFRLELLINLQNQANIYNIYISDTRYINMTKYPDSENQVNQNNFYLKLYKASSILELEIREYLTSKWKEKIKNDSVGLVLDSNDVVTLKFLDSVFLSKFIF
jgi:hypothetical protein